MIVYHTSSEIIDKIHDHGLFGRFLCFATSPYFMTASKDTIVYEATIDDDDIIAARQLFYDDNASTLDDIVTHVMTTYHVDRDDAEDLLSEIKSTLDFDALATNADVSWHIQQLTAECATRLGYIGVEMRDEQGTLYMIDATRITLTEHTIGE